jgi:hypothetical protein
MVAWVSDSVFPFLNAGEWEGLAQLNEGPDTNTCVATFKKAKIRLVTY